MAWSRLTLTLNDNPSSVNASSKIWTNGWVGAAGLDYMLGEHFSIGVAYEILKLKDHNKNVYCASCGTGSGFGTPLVNADVTLQTATARLTYFFNI